MYQIGDKVTYGIHGVCAIVDTEQRVIDRNNITYLVLEPISQAGARYLVPTHNQVAMSKLSAVMDKQALLALLSDSAASADAWIRDENSRKQRYRELIGSGDRLRLMQMCASLYRHREEQLSAGRKIHMCDENFLRDAEKLLCSEISLVMEVTSEEAKRILYSNLRIE